MDNSARLRNPPVNDHVDFAATSCARGTKSKEVFSVGHHFATSNVGGKFEEGKSMAYAASASPLTDGDGQRYKGRVMCASTSFYDEKGFVWIWK